MTIKQNGGIFGRKPTFNGVTDEGTTRLESLGVNIGTDTPTTFAEIRSNGVSGEETILQLTRPTYGECMTFGRAAGDGVIKSNRNIIIRADADNNSVGSDSNIIFQYDGSNEAARFNSDGNLAFPSGQGIDFSATSGTGTSELFDDYEEGTWTPVPADAASGGNTGTTSSALGNYTKIGDVVFVTGVLVNINTSGMTAGNSLYVQGLPFSTKDIVGATAYYMGGGVITSAVTTSSLVSPYILDSGSSSLNFFDTGGNILVSEVTSGAGDFYFSLTYKAS